jgi:hypothetical protein
VSPRIGPRQGKAGKPTTSGTSAVNSRPASRGIARSVYDAVLAAKHP